MDPRTAAYMEAARDLWQLHNSLRPLAPMVRHTQVTLALSILLYGLESTEDERLALGELVAVIGTQEEKIPTD
jgi:hypothetical protein